MTSGKPGRPCTICTDRPKREFVARRLAEGYSAIRIERASRTDEAANLGVGPMKRETVARHITIHLGAEAPEESTPVQRHEVAVMAARVQVGLADPDDIALLVRKQAAEMLREGKLRITTQHALQSQQMLDRRDEKKKDRELQYSIAALMLAAEPPDTIIDGHATEV